MLLFWGFSRPLGLCELMRLVPALPLYCSFRCPASPLPYALQASRLHGILCNGSAQEVQGRIPRLVPQQHIGCCCGAAVSHCIVGFGK